MAQGVDGKICVGLLLAKETPANVLQISRVVARQFKETPRNR